MHTVQTVMTVLFPALMIVAGLKDATSFTIPNWISLALLAAFAPAAMAAGLGWPEIGMHLAIGMAALVAGMVMFSLNWIGGGDAKLLAAACLWLGLTALAPFLLVTALAGGALAIVLVRLRHPTAREALAGNGPGWVGRLLEPKGPAPYGVAIAAGALFAFPQSSLLALAGVS